jgi:UDP-N-acetylglucosamine 2-epimerase
MSAAPVALFFGTRPQVIKASVLRDALTAVTPLVAVDTGQHYDHSLHKIHYEQLGVADPDVYLGVGSGSHAEQTAAILVAAEAWILAHKPRLAVVIGDTNSTLACALAAAKARVPVAHVEAGLRAADALMAEEINRRCVDVIAAHLFAPSRRAEAALRREGVPGEIHRVGDVAYDVLRRALERGRAVTVAVPKGGYIYVTLHRAELVSDPELLRGVFNALGKVRQRVVFAVHPRTSSALKQAGVHTAQNIELRPPVGYLESLRLLQGAAAVVTDSGGIQREAYWLGIPCITMRTETEWVETVEAGANRLVEPSAAERLSDSVWAAMEAGSCGWEKDAYGDGTAAERIAAILAEPSPVSSPA